MNKLHKVSLDKIISNALHYPKLNGIPLYIRVDGRMDDMISQYDNDEYRNVGKVLCGSPDNIRRVFITHRSVIVHYYRPVGKSKEFVKETINKYPFGEILYNRYNLGMRDDYYISGLALRALYRPWVCSNIEEVYFDWTIFLSVDIYNIFGDLFRYFSTNRGGTADASCLKELFRLSCLPGVSDVKDRFPRLKAIGYVENLEALYRSITFKNKQTLIDYLTPVYMHENFQMVLNDPSSSAYLIIFDNDILNSKFSLKDGIYKYDLEYLKSYFELLSERIEAHKKEKYLETKAKEREDSIKKINNMKSVVEICLDEISEKEGLDKAINDFRIMLKGLSKNEVMEILNEMSSEGKQKYGRGLRLIS